MPGRGIGQEANIQGDIYPLLFDSFSSINPVVARSDDKNISLIFLFSPEFHFAEKTTARRGTFRCGKLSLDLFPIKPIIGEIPRAKMSTVFSLSLIIVVLLAVLIIKDLLVVRMAPVRVRK